MNAITHARINPLRRPKGFEPTVQRWSVAFPKKFGDLYVSFLGVQARTADDLNGSPFLSWIQSTLEREDRPIIHDHARHIDSEGYHTHITTLYWLSADTANSWRREADLWWEDPARLEENTGYFREELRVPRNRQETLYWQDYPAGLSRSDEVSIYPTPYCGYYGAMRDRIPLAATDELAAEDELPLSLHMRATAKAHWRIDPPRNVAVIRSATYWGDCDPDQMKDFTENLRGPLEAGMQFLVQNPQVSGCCSMRYQQSCDAAGATIPETHALAFFHSLAQMEEWAERHTSHHAIFRAAMARYRKYGTANQLRTWHEVYVLPREGQSLRYINCHARTGLLPFYKATRIA